jgi:tRNA pseudouridine32 synthase / 23S rRNA pseudouridine746 synthase
MKSWDELRAQSLILEDEAILALNKPSGISVTGERHETDVVELAQEAGEQLFPVHRIDKVTSGLILFAKTITFHGGLTRQFNKRTVDKAYLVITRSTGLPSQGIIDLPLSAGRKGRIRIAALRESIVADSKTGRWFVRQADVLDTRNYPSITQFATVWTDDEYSILVVRPVTGRRHQIRVHLAWIGHPILGDPLFDKAGAEQVGRTFLHSWQLGIDAAWLDGKRLEIEATPGQDFWEPIRERLPEANPAIVLLEAQQLIESLKSLPHS